MSERERERREEVCGYEWEGVSEWLRRCVPDRGLRKSGRKREREWLVGWVGGACERKEVKWCKQCDQIGRFIALWATFQSLWQQFFCPNYPYFSGIFVKVSKSFIFLVISFLCNFYGHLFGNFLLVTLLNTLAVEEVYDLPSKYYLDLSSLTWPSIELNFRDSIQGSGQACCHYGCRRRLWRPPQRRRRR